MLSVGVCGCYSGCYRHENYNIMRNHPKIGCDCGRSPPLFTYRYHFDTHHYIYPWLFCSMNLLIKFVLSLNILYFLQLACNTFPRLLRKVLQKVQLSTTQRNLYFRLIRGKKFRKMAELTYLFKNFYCYSRKGNVVYNVFLARFLMILYMKCRFGIYSIKTKDGKRF